MVDMNKEQLRVMCLAREHDSRGSMEKLRFWLAGVMLPKGSIVIRRDVYETMERSANCSISLDREIDDLRNEIGYMEDREQAAFNAGKEAARVKALSEREKAKTQ